MKFLLDQGLPRSTVTHLEAAGITAEHVGDLGLATASDATILSTGLALNSRFASGRLSANEPGFPSGLAASIGAIHLIEAALPVWSKRVIR